MLFKILYGDDTRISTDVTPYHEGYCYVTSKQDFYVDLNGVRTKLNAKDAETIMGCSISQALSASEVEIPSSFAVSNAIADELSKFASKSVNVTLTAASWSENKQTVTVSGLGATQNGIIGPANNLTADQQSAMGNAQLYVVSQASDEVTIGCHGDTPTIDVPITVILFP